MFSPNRHELLYIIFSFCATTFLI